MSLITIVLVFMMAIVVTVFISHLLPVKIPLPLLQIAAGAGLAAGGFQVDFDPHIFLLLFIPPLLFLDGWRIPKDAFFSDLKPILSLAIGLVLVTIIGIGWFIHWLIPAITVAAGFTLAAILSPTDPVAVSAVIVQGSSDVSLYNIKQSDLSVSVQGSGDVKLAGAVERLRIDIAGSGDVNADQLMSLSADVHVRGSGDVRTWVCESVKARVTGSGDVVVWGNPVDRDCSVVGSGEIRFR
ncbi:hypothetical protein ELI64_29830 [Klebsiella pneumoniae]|uniref:Cation:proton antiporter n=8 Tax=Klebsiella/Raoultella group TaxID=2890311 RepID=A0A7H0EVH9_KLEVA|nr:MULTISPECIES: cation:proton antiporter [Enterobacteriaceae]ARD69385.1 Hypothetical protein [Raoultella ornithinolytica]EKU0050135.1 cation:proton antiporter [Klebsiella quasipneumoniae]EKU3500330.1 cation:proton antiporter [Klebsiella quasipneumoniae]EKU3511047.1 cation:proton antiporter [Klebsiella quasipneumoniae]EKU3528979.1 cation:proton antiporter [Klebsiella quasipneumoniae]